MSHVTCLINLFVGMPLPVEITVWTRAAGDLGTHYQGNGFHIKDVNIKGKATKRMKKVLEKE